MGHIGRNVSRQSCPVCWELLDIMDSLIQFSISDRHPIIHAVKLPPWLLHNTMEEMVTCLERFLREQISTMMLN